jgi:soluble lytic murein transglycosylase-like protein
VAALIRSLVAAATLLLPWAAAAQGVAAWQPLIDEASARFGVPVSWITTVMRIESRGRTTMGGRPIVSPAGAMGLMQLMPATWAAMRQRLALGADPFDPHDNILAGTLYLRLMYDRFGYPGCFAAYNAGPGRYAAFLAGRPLPIETVRYVSWSTPLRITAAAAPVPRIIAVATPHSRPLSSIFAIPPRQ